jgi:four helix bundle protein
MELFELSKSFPREETYALTDQMRRAARSVCGNLAEAWRKRIYEAAFVAKLNDSEGEAAETQSWIDFAVRSKYMDRDKAVELFKTYEEILRMLVAMRCNADQWIIPPDKR